MKLFTLPLALVAVLILTAPSSADTITFTGTFIDQPVAYATGDWTVFYHRGALVEMWGRRYLLADRGWTMLPRGKDWVTRDTTFTAEFDDESYMLFDPVVDGPPPLYGPDPITEADPYVLSLSGTSLNVFLSGYQVGHADLDRVPEPSTLFLLGIGIAGLIGYGWRRR